MLSVVPADHTNTVIVTHQPNMLAALGKDSFDVKEGEPSIFPPVDGGYELIARVKMDNGDASRRSPRRNATGKGGPRRWHPLR